MKFYMLRALSTVVNSIHRVSDQTSRWHSVLSLALTGSQSQHTGKDLSPSRLIILLFWYRFRSPQLRNSLGQVHRSSGLVLMTFFCDFALLLFASSVKFWPTLYNEFTIYLWVVWKNYFLCCLNIHTSDFVQWSFFFSSALEKITTVVNYLFHATPVIYFPDLNHASLLLIQNLMYPYIWIMCFFPLLSGLKLIYVRFETRGTTTTCSSNENPTVV